MVFSYWFYFDNDDDGCCDIVWQLNSCSCGFVVVVLLGYACCCFLWRCKGIDFMLLLVAVVWLNCCWSCFLCSYFNAVVCCCGVLKSCCCCGYCGYAAAICNVSKLLLFYG